MCIYFCIQALAGSLTSTGGDKACLHWFLFVLFCLLPCFEFFIGFYFFTSLQFLSCVGRCAFILLLLFLSIFSFLSSFLSFSTRVAVRLAINAHLTEINKRIKQIEYKHNVSFFSSSLYFAAAVEMAGMVCNAWVLCCRQAIRINKKLLI